MNYTKELHLQHTAAWWDGKLERLAFGLAVPAWEKSPRPPLNDADPKYYRIRPEPKLRPWKPEEVPVGALLRFSNGNPDGHVPWKYMLLAHSETHIVIITIGLQPRSYTFSELLPNGEHSTDGGRTWKPCGVEESQ